MSEYETLFSDEFFIIDSKNLNTVKTRLYGYVVDLNSNTIVTNENLDEISEGYLPNGCYVYVKCSGNQINIYQDSEGCYGIHVYKHDSGFCISNSFAKLVEYVRDKYQITLNNDYSNTYLSTHLQSFIYKQTLVNEIEVLPRNASIKIDITSKTLKYEEFNFDEKSVPINSEQAMQILDKWFCDWTSLFRNLKLETNNIWVDLSGGFDSRGIFSLILSSKINLDECVIHSIKDTEYTHSEDYEIATDISNHLGFTLNNFNVLSNDKYYFSEMDTALNISLYTKLGFHNQLHFKTNRNKNPLFLVGGSGGELIRDFQSGGIDTYLNYAKDVSPKIVKSAQKILDYNKENIKNFEDISFGIYRETRNRYHFGKACVEDFFSNAYALNAYLDPNLNKIKRKDSTCDDNDLLIALLFVRFCPELLDFKFEGGRYIKSSTLEYAKQINDKYPFKKPSYNLVSKTNEPKLSFNYNVFEPKLVNQSNNFTIKEIETYLKKIFFSYHFRKMFETYFSYPIYRYFARRVETATYFPTQYTYQPFAVMKIIDDVNINKKLRGDVSTWLNSFVDDSYFDRKNNYVNEDSLTKYITGRIDIINYGADNDIEIISLSDEESYVYGSLWMDRKVGQGKIVENSKCSIKIKFRCKGNGNLRIFLRGKDIMDKNHRRFPVYVEYTKFVVNNNNILPESIAAWHDKPFEYSKEVSNDEVIEIELEWKPIDEKSTYPC